MPWGAELESNPWCQFCRPVRYSRRCVQLLPVGPLGWSCLLFQLGLLAVLLPEIRMLVVALEPIRLSMATSYKSRSGSRP